VSYDIAVFDPAAVDDSGLPAWFAAQSRWDEDHGYDEARATDYSVGRQIVHAAFAWSVADEARRACLDAARRSGVAVALVSDDGAVVRP
jgi:hypothetical protein